MVQNFFLAATLFTFFSLAAAHAQLGPKDGTGSKHTDLDRVKAGDIAPAFTLEDMDGRRISLSDFRGKKNVVLVFYRGHW